LIAGNREEAKMTLRKETMLRQSGEKRSCRRSMEKCIKVRIQKKRERWRNVGDKVFLEKRKRRRYAMREKKILLLLCRDKE